VLNLGSPKLWLGLKGGVMNNNLEQALKEIHKDLFRMDVIAGVALALYVVVVAILLIIL
jgi:hypothetical protein